MNQAIILASLSGIIFFLAPIFLRSNAVLVFLSLCASEQLVNLVSKDVTEFVNSSITLDSYPTYSIVQIFLLLIAPIIILFVYRNSVKASKLFWQIIPAFSAAVMCFLMVIQKLPYDTKILIEQSSLYETVEPFFQVVLVSGIVTSIIFLIFNRPKIHKKDKDLK